MITHLLEDYFDDVAKAMDICQEEYGVLHNIDVAQVDDPGIEDYSRIVLTLTVSEMPLEVLDAEKRVYKRWMDEIGDMAFSYLNISYIWKDD